MDIILTAIRERRCLSFWWQGGERVVHPHIYGVNQRGQVVLLCWQVTGHKRIGKLPAWKSIPPREVRGLMALDTIFVPHEGYREKQKKMKRIYSQIEELKGPPQNAQSCGDYSQVIDVDSGYARRNGLG